MMNTDNSNVQALMDNFPGLELIAPDLFDVDKYIKEMENNPDTSCEFVSAANNNTFIRFESVYDDERKKYFCVATSVVDGSSDKVFSFDEGNMSHGITDVEEYIKANFSEGLYDSEDYRAIAGERDLLQVAETGTENIEQNVNDTVSDVSDGLYADTDISTQTEILDSLNKEIIETSSDVSQPGAEIPENDEQIEMSPVIQELFKLFDDGGKYEEYREDVARGIIPQQLREGFWGSDGIFTKEVVEEIRSYRPDFGYFVGIDTSKFNISNKNETVTSAITSISGSDLVKAGVNVDEKDILKVRAYLDYGGFQRIDNVNMCVSNLCVLEVKERHDNYRVHVLIDDTGVIKHQFDGMDKIMLTPGITRLDAFDRTNPENRACLSYFKNCTAEERQDKIDKFNAAMPSYDNNYVEHALRKYNGDMVDRYAARIEVRLRNIEPVMNVIELAKEYKTAIIASDLADIKDSISNLSGALEAGKGSTAPETAASISDATQDVADKYEKYCQDFKEFSHEAYYEALGQIRTEFSADTQAIKDIRYEQGILFGMNEIENSPETYISAEKNNYHGNEMSESDRFSLTVDAQFGRQTGIPVDNSATFDAGTYSSVFESAVKTLSEAVDRYNGTNPEYKVSFDRESGRIFLCNGIEIKPEVFTCKEDGVGIREYNTELKPFYDEKHDTEKQGSPFDINAYLNSAPEGSDKSRRDIYKEVFNSVIANGKSGQLTDMHPIATRFGRSEINAWLTEANLTPDSYKDMLDNIEKNVGVDTFTDKNSFDIELPDNSGSTSVSSDEEIKEAYYKAEKLEYISFPIGQTDYDKKINISAEKRLELREYAEKEYASNGYENAEVFEQKLVFDLMSDLRMMKSDLANVEEKIDKIKNKLDGLPSRYLNTHAIYRVACLEKDTIIHKMADMGAAVGANEFITRGVDSKQLFLENIDCRRTDIFSSAAYNHLYQTEIKIGDVFEKGQTPVYSPVIQKYYERIENLEKATDSKIFKAIISRIERLLGLDKIDRIEPAVMQDVVTDTKDIEAEQNKDLEDAILEAAIENPETDIETENSDQDNVDAGTEKAENTEADSDDQDKESDKADSDDGNKEDDKVDSDDTDDEEGSVRDLTAESDDKDSLEANESAYRVDTFLPDDNPDVLADVNDVLDPVTTEGSDAESVVLGEKDKNSVETDVVMVSDTDAGSLQEEQLNEADVSSEPEHTEARQPEDTADENTALKEDVANDISEIIKGSDISVEDILGDAGSLKNAVESGASVEDLTEMVCSGIKKGLEESGDFEKAANVLLDVSEYLDNSVDGLYNTDLINEVMFAINDLQYSNDAIENIHNSIDAQIDVGTENVGILDDYEIEWDSNNNDIVQINGTEPNRDFSEIENVDIAEIFNDPVDNILDRVASEYGDAVADTFVDAVAERVNIDINNDINVNDAGYIDSVMNEMQGQFESVHDNDFGPDFAESVPNDTSIQDVHTETVETDFNNDTDTGSVDGNIQDVINDGATDIDEGSGIEDLAAFLL